MLGVCCDCQSAHPIHRRTDLPSEELEDPMGPFGCGEAGHYAMDDHLIFGDSGPRCEGFDTTPQAIIPEKTAVVAGQAMVPVLK